MPVDRWEWIRDTAANISAHWPELEPCDAVKFAVAIWDETEKAKRKKEGENRE